MALNLQGRILDKAANGSYVSNVSAGINEEDQRLLDAMKAPERKEESEFSKQTSRMEKSLNKSTSIFSKGMDFVGSIFQSRVAEEEKYHRALIDLANKLKTTEHIIKSNSDTLEKAAGSDENLARLLSTLSETSGDREAILEKILDRQELSTEDAAKLLEYLDRSVEALGKVDTTLDVNLTEVIDLYKGMIQDDRIDTKQRRKLLEEIQAYISDAGIQTDAINKLNEINLNSIEFDKKTTIDLVRLLSQISEDAQGKKVTGTLDELNKKYDKSILSQDELADVLTKPTKEGKSFRESFVLHPEIYSKGETLKKGAIGTLLQATGLGALESIGAVDLISDLFSVGTAKKVGAGVKTGFGKVAGVFKPKGGIEGVEEVLGGEETPEDKLNETEGKVEQSNKGLLNSVLLTQDILFNHAESMEAVNKILGDKKKKNTLINKLDAFDDTLEESTKNIEKGSAGFASGMLLLAAKAALLVGTFAAAYKFGSWLSDKIDEKMGRGKGGIGDWLYEKKEQIFGSDVEKGEQLGKESTIKRRKDQMTPEAFELLGKDKASVSTFAELKDSGQIVNIGGKWYTSDQVSELHAETSVQKPKSQVVAKTELAIKEPLSAQERLMQERALTVTGKIEPSAIEETKELPADTISPEIARSAQERLMQERARKVTQTPVISGGGKSNVGSGRTAQIDDYSIALFNSMVFE